MIVSTQTTVARIPSYCALCVSRGGPIAVVEKSRFVALEPDPFETSPHRNRRIP